MGLGLLPLVFFAFFAGMLSLQSYRTQLVTPSATSLHIVQSGQMFIAYRNAIALYQQSNPTFTGSVSAAALVAQGTPFNAAFLATAGNAITASGISGRIMTCYASLPAGALQSASLQSGYDASLGIASGATWTSIAASATAQPLATPVPSGALVSVVQVGS